MQDFQKLFSYGTLQQPEVQLATFGHMLAGKPDALCGYRLEKIRIIDQDVIKTSGKEFHPILTYSGDEKDEISGTVFDVTSQELQNADKYEVAQYKRAEVVLKSGCRAWVYVAT